MLRSRSDDVRRQLIQSEAPLNAQRNLIDEKTSGLEQLTMERALFLAELRQQANQ